MKPRARLSADDVNYFINIIKCPEQDNIAIFMFFNELGIKYPEPNQAYDLSLHQLSPAALHVLANIYPRYIQTRINGIYPPQSVVNTEYGKSFYISLNTLLHNLPKEFNLNSAFVSLMTTGILMPLSHDAFVVSYNAIYQPPKITKQPAATSSVIPLAFTSQSTREMKEDCEADNGKRVEQPTNTVSINKVAEKEKLVNELLQSFEIINAKIADIAASREAERKNYENEIARLNGLLAQAHQTNKLLYETNQKFLAQTNTILGLSNSSLTRLPIAPTPAVVHQFNPPAPNGYHQFDAVFYSRSNSSKRRALQQPPSGFENQNTQNKQSSQATNPQNRA